MTSFEKQVLEDLAGAENKYASGSLATATNGRLHELEGRVQKHEVFVQKAGGIGTLIAGLLTVLHVGIDYLRLHHTP